jgi:hydrocephalus-inducing protein
VPCIQDITFEGLPENKLDELRVADCPTGVSRQVTFSVRNHSSSKNIRFKWPTNLPNLSFSPAVAHVHADSSKDVTLTFKVRNLKCASYLSCKQAAQAVPEC